MKKFKKTKAWLFAIVMIAIPALIICELYPTLRQQAEESAEEAIDDNSWRVADQDAVAALCKGLYVLYYEAMADNSSEMLEPADILLTEEPEDAVEAQEQKDGINDLLYRWQIDFEAVRQEIYYGVFDKHENYLAGNGDEESIRRYLNKVYDDKYDVAFTVKFNRNGNLAVIQTDGNEDEYTLPFFREQLAFYMDAYSYEEYYEDIDEWYYYEEMDVPKDISIVYAIPSSVALMSNDLVDEIYEDYYYYGYHSTDLDLWLLMLCTVSVMIIWYLAWRRRPVATYFAISWLPAETVLLIVPGISCFNAIGARRLIGTYQGSYYLSLTSYINNPDIMNIVIGLYNILTWLVFFTGVFIIAAAAGRAFQTGLRTWLRETSLCYRGYKLFKKYWDHYAGLLKKSRLEDGQIRKRACQLLLLNAIICGLFCALWLVGIVGVIIYTLVVMGAALTWLASVEHQYNELLENTKKLAAGDLDLTYKSMPGPFDTYNVELSKVQHGFKKAVEKETASQKMKTELITNVSHDLKTPLTAIITYVNLLKEDNVSEEERRQYIETLDKKALRLKVLIEDLFEVSKAESRSVTMNYVDVNLPDLIKQVYVEHEYKFQEAGLEVKIDLPDELVLDLDSQKTYRIFENLLNNCVKYSMKGTRVYIRCIETDAQVSILVRNISAEELADITPERLTERFIRGDQSRNTEGSGLGLAIARNFTELQGGHMDLEIDGDLFKVIVTFTKENRKEQ